MTSTLERRRAASVSCTLSLAQLFLAIHVLTYSPQSGGDIAVWLANVGARRTAASVSRFLVIRVLTYSPWDWTGTGATDEQVDGVEVNSLGGVALPLLSAVFSTPLDPHPRVLSMESRLVSEP